MTVRYVRPVSHSAYAARRIGLAALVLFLLAALAHRFGPLRLPDFLALLLLSAALAAVAVPLALIGLQRLWQKGAEGGIAAAKGLAYSAVPLAVVVTGVLSYSRLPALYEITTDLADPPPFLRLSDADQQWLPRPASLTPADRRSQIEAYPGLAGRSYEGALDRVFEGVQAAAASARIAIVLREGTELMEPEALPQEPAPAEEGDALSGSLDMVPVPLPRPELSLVGPVFDPSGDVLLQGETRTLFFGLPFDVVIRLREDVETTSVDIRVASRYGPHDLGIGAAIARDFLSRLDTELLGIAGG